MKREDRGYFPSLMLRNGLFQTIYNATVVHGYWEKTISLSPITYGEKVFYGFDNVPIYALTAIPPRAKGTIIGTYGITGTLENQWFLDILARKAFDRGYGVILFDWRAHGKTAELSPVLTSDGLFEGRDYVAIASQAKQQGFPSKFWFTGYSLGGQLALWGIFYGSQLPENSHLTPDDIGGCGVICPSLDSERSLTYLENHPIKKYLDKVITKALRELTIHLHSHHPHDIDISLLPMVDSIRNFDRYFVISGLGFENVRDYYYASSPFRILSQIKKPTLIFYAEDDPMFCPSIIPELQKQTLDNPCLDLRLTRYGGHVSYISSKKGQEINNDDDMWWVWNRFLDWVVTQDMERS